MKEMIRFGLVLAVICMVAAGLLASVNALTRSKIYAQAQTEEEVSLRGVLPEGVRFEPVTSGNETVYYKAFDSKKQLIGAAFKAEGKGYSGTIETMVGMLTDGTIVTIKVLAQDETPGLGARVCEPAFSQQFARKHAQELATVQAITGATISSKAVIDSVQKKAQEIRVLMQNGR
jgi:electron transport complex protein RnfG